MNGSALAGPVVSLLQGVVFGLIVSKGRKNTAGHLLFLWLSLLAFPVAALLSAIYPATSSYVILSSFGAILHTSSSRVSHSECEAAISKPLVLLTVRAIILNRLLTLGVG